MDSLIETFHIDIKLLVAQAINFAIVFAVLYWLILKPLLKTMHDRTKKIEKSIIDAEKSEKNLARTEKDYGKKMAEAKKEANRIIENAKEQAEVKKQDMITKAKADIGVLINEEKAKMQAEKGKILKEIKRQAADMVALALEKVLEKKIDSEEDREIIKKSIKE